MSETKNRYLNVAVIAMLAIAMLMVFVPTQASGAVTTTVSVNESDRYNVVTGDTVTVSVEITGGTWITSCQVAIYDNTGAQIDKLWVNQSGATTFTDDFVFEGLDDGDISVLVTGTDANSTVVLATGVYEIVNQVVMPVGITSWTDGYNIVLFAILFIVILCVLLLLLRGKQVQSGQMKYVVIMAVISFLVAGFIYLLIGGTLMDIYDYLVGLF